MRRAALIVSLLVVTLVAGGGMAVARSSPALRATGPGEITGAPSSAPFTIADRTVRQVRYVDHGTLRYTFSLTNEGRLPVTVVGLGDEVADPRLFDLAQVSRASLAPGETAPVTVTLTMNGCESLSSRSGSFLDRLPLATSTAGVIEDDVVVTLPEELHTGSAREASCPEATATSRPQG